MNALRQFRLELHRLIHSPIALLVMLLTALSPLIGFTLYRPVSSSTATMLSGGIADPALAGGLLGAILFGLLTIWELDRVNRSGFTALMEAAVSPLTSAIVRLCALISSSLLTQIATLILWLPYTRHVVGAVFDLKSYLGMYGVFMYGAIPLAILFAAAAHQFTQRLDLSLALFAAFAGLSLTVWREQWQLCWLNPCVWAVSDDFTNIRLLRSVGYVRLTWALALMGLWGLSYLCVRRYGKGCMGSLLRSSRRFYRPILSLALVAISCLAYIHQPFLDHSKAEIDPLYPYGAALVEGVTASSLHALVTPNPDTGEVYGKAIYQIQNASGQMQSVRFQMQPGYRVSSVSANGKAVPYSLGSEVTNNIRELTVELPNEPEIELSIEYGGLPQDWNIMSTMQGGPEISHQYMCLENQVLSPAPLDFAAQGGLLSAIWDITLPDALTVIPFGNDPVKVLQEQADGTVTWRIQGDGPFEILYIGDYVREDIQSAGLNVEFYYARKHQSIMKQAGAVQAIQQVIEYCTQRIGSLSFASDQGLKLIESRISGGGYAADGASLIDESDFTMQNMADSQKGSSPAEVMIHELVHQWWGLGCMFDPEGEQEIWSAEGLTTYTTYRIVKALYGEEIAQTHYIEQWQNEVKNYYNNFYVRHPEYLSALPEEHQAEISNSLRTVRQYSEMALKILKAEKLVGGEQAMDEILHDLFNRELDPAYPYLTYQDFLKACNLTEEDLSLEKDLSI